MFSQASWCGLSYCCCVHVGRHRQPTLQTQLYLHHHCHHHHMLLCCEESLHLQFCLVGSCVTQAHLFTHTHLLEKQRCFFFSSSLWTKEGFPWDADTAWRVWQWDERRGRYVITTSPDLHIARHGWETKTKHHSNAMFGESILLSSIDSLWCKGHIQILLMTALVGLFALQSCFARIKMTPVTMSTDINSFPFRTKFTTM